MNFKEYEKLMENVPYTNSVKYQPAIMWLHRERLPLGVVDLGDDISGIVKIPCKAKNEYGNHVPVIAIKKNLFAGREHITDIILPHSIERLPAGAFAGCKGLRRITIPRKIRTIKEGTFACCDNLEDVYYEGTPEEWENLIIVHQKHETVLGNLIPGTPVCEILEERLLHIPGNDALFTANIHFHCTFPDQVCTPSFKITVENKEITDFFRTI